MAYIETTLTNEIRRLTMSDEKSNPSTRFIPVTKWNEFHKWPPIGGLRHLIFNAKFNGFDVVIKRCGRRVLIDEKAFFTWIIQQNSGEKK